MMCAVVLLLACLRNSFLPFFRAGDDLGHFWYLYPLDSRLVLHNPSWICNIRLPSIGSATTRQAKALLLLCPIVSLIIIFEALCESANTFISWCLLQIKKLLLHQRWILAGYSCIWVVGHGGRASSDEAGWNLLGWRWEYGLVAHGWSDAMIRVPLILLGEQGRSWARRSSTIRVHAQLVVYLESGSLRRNLRAALWLVGWSASRLTRRFFLVAIWKDQCTVLLKQILLLVSSVLRKAGVCRLKWFSEE